MAHGTSSSRGCDRRRSVPTWTGDDPFAAHVYKGKVAAATHGGLPFRDPTTLVLFGPGVRAGAALDHCRYRRHRPDHRRVAGFDLDDVDGLVLAELIQPN